MQRWSGLVVGCFLTFWGTSPVLTQDSNTGIPPTDLAIRLNELEAEVKQLRAITENQTIVPASHESDSTSPSYCVPPKEPDFPTVKMTGFFQTDLGWINQDFVNRATLGDIQDGWDFRRARLAAGGNVTEDVSYLIEMDFAQLQPWFVDVWMDFANVGNVMNVRIGRFRQPFGMTELNSIRELPFLERPLLFGLAPFRQTGIMAYGNDDKDNSNLTWAASGYRYLSDNFGNVYADNGGWGLAMRGTLLPIYQNDGRQLFHLGADYSFNDPGRDLVFYANAPEFVQGQNPALGPAGLDKLPISAITPFVNTGAMPTDRTHLFNLEAAGGVGNLYVQSEVRWAVVDRQNGQKSETFPGAYAHARYILTGEKLPYKRASGLFGRVVPDNPVKFGGGGGIGAWELATRLSWLDLNGTNLPGPGRDLTNVTFGLNWYLNRYTKFQFNYINANLDDPRLGRSDANIYAVRGQIDF
ncbi:MAG: porin [Planctomycetaceae bacterium]|nr:porin [Planctomycetaceae bacterium]